MSSVISVKIESRIAEVQLNRPEKANALNEELWFALEQTFLELDENDEVKVCVLKGAGMHFSSGIDLEYLQSIGQKVEEFDCEGRKREFLRRLILKLQNAFTAIEKCRKPVIAAIHGGCIGGGVDLIAACDMRYSTKDAVFQISEIDVGLTADVGTLQRLPHLIPQGMVRELAYTGRKFSGEEAHTLGLVNACFENPAEMEAEVGKIAEMISKKAPLALRGTKEMLLHARDHSVSEGLNYVATWNSAMLLSSDLEESVMAKMMNRTPEYKN